MTEPEARDIDWSAFGEVFAELVEQVHEDIALLLACAPLTGGLPDLVAQGNLQW